ncbi:MAG TPA: rod shape-determining protein MreD [Vicinamibacterales bacterium]|nr:rod shape-determining protein MreD [Vicinamibacterales bacterium]
MKLVRVLLTVVVALTLQMALARYAVAGRWVFDLVVVGVIYAALYWGPTAGMWTGTLGGLMQDSLSGDVVGLGGFAKTVVGFGAGVLGAQFIVGRPFARSGAVAVATVVHRLIVVGLLGIVDRDWPGFSWTAMLMETGLNTVAGLLAFQLTEVLPGAVHQTRERRRSSLSRRRW